MEMILNRNNDDTYRIESPTQDKEFVVASKSRVVNFVYQWVTSIRDPVFDETITHSFFEVINLQILFRPFFFFCCSVINDLSDGSSFRPPTDSHSVYIYITSVGSFLVNFQPLPFSFWFWHAHITTHCNPLEYKAHATSLATDREGARLGNSRAPRQSCFIMRLFKCSARSSSEQQHKKKRGQSRNNQLYFLRGRKLVADAL